MHLQFIIIMVTILIPYGHVAAVDDIIHDPLGLVDCRPPRPAASPSPAQGTGGGDPRAPALYVLGDSLLDSGNNNILPTLARANYPPYGDSFSNRCASGRFTNGKTVADFIAEFLGLPYSPPYIAIRRILGSATSTTTGFNYASGSCGILKHTGSSLGICLSLDDQINLFNETIHHQKLNSADNHHLPKSIFVIAVGNNDYINGYFDPNSNLTKQYDAEQFSHLLITQLSQQLQRLYNIGARKIILFDVGPLGCIPNMALKIKHSGQCVEDQNRIVSIYNAKLTPLLHNLTSSLPGSHFVLGRSHDLALDAILNPAKYGLKNSTAPCCKSWSNNTLSCIPGLPPCQNPNQYFFWDGYHLTQAVYSTIASRCITNSDFCTPLNIQQLIRI